MNSVIQARFKAARALFPHTKKIVYFNAASYGPFASTLRDAVDENMQLRMAADRDDSHFAYGVADQLREDYAGLIGAKKNQVGIGLHTTFGLNLAALQCGGRGQSLGRGEGRGRGRGLARQWRIRRVGGGSESDR